MPIDAPDWTTWTQRVEVVGDTPVPEQAANEAPISRLNKVSTSSTDYQALLSYTVPADTTTVLYGVEFFASPFNKAHLRLTIGGVVQWTDQEIPTSLNVHFSEARFAAAVVVLLEVKSTDGTAVDAWGALEGKELS